MNYFFYLKFSIFNVGTVHKLLTRNVLEDSPSLSLSLPPLPISLPLSLPLSLCVSFFSYVVQKLKKNTCPSFHICRLLGFRTCCLSNSRFLHPFGTCVFGLKLNSVNFRVGLELSFFGGGGGSSKFFLYAKST